jgi:hypothetical protein
VREHLYSNQAYRLALVNSFMVLRFSIIGALLTTSLLRTTSKQAGLLAQVTAAQSSAEIAGST